jgi:hypothetical protein
VLNHCPIINRIRPLGSATLSYSLYRLHYPACVSHGHTSPTPVVWRENLWDLHILLRAGHLPRNHYVFRRSCDQGSRLEFAWVSVVVKQMLRRFPISNSLWNAPHAALSILINPNGIHCCGRHQIPFQKYEIYNQKIKSPWPLVEVLLFTILTLDALSPAGIKSIT